LKLSAFRKKKASAKDNWIIYHRAPTLFPAKSNTSLRRSVLSSGNRRNTKSRLKKLTATSAETSSKRNSLKCARSMAAAKN
jgi:hypothetical protein